MLEVLLDVDHQQAGVDLLTIQHQCPTYGHQILVKKDDIA